MCAQPRDVSAERLRIKYFRMGSRAPMCLKLQTPPPLPPVKLTSIKITVRFSGPFQCRNLNISRGAHLRAQACPSHYNPPQFLKRGSVNSYEMNQASPTLLTKESSSPKVRVLLSHFLHCAVPSPATSRAVCSLSSEGNAWKEMHCHSGRFPAAFGGKFWINST